MSGSVNSISNELEFKSVVDELEKLLGQQLEHARKGDVNELETLAFKTNGLVELISESEFLNGPQFVGHRRHIQELYGQICLALSAQMDDISQSLDRVYKGKKAVTLYRDNI